MREVEVCSTVCRREPAPGQFRHPGQGDLFLTPCRLRLPHRRHDTFGRWRPRDASALRRTTDEKALAAIHQLVEELEERAREAGIAAPDTRK
jgi:hypothetical protein